MNRAYAGAACIMILFAGEVYGADSISSAITCNWAIWTTTLLIGQGKAYVADLFTTDVAALLRDITIQPGEKIQTATSVRSKGPLGIHEYSSQKEDQGVGNESCVFERGPEKPPESGIWYFGLLTSGAYTSSRRMDNGVTAVTGVNGTGMLLSRIHSAGENGTVTDGKTTIAGDMNVTEGVYLSMWRLIRW